MATAKQRHTRGILWPTTSWITDHVKTRCGSQIANISSWSLHANHSLNRPVYFCWAVGGNMCLTSVSLARCLTAEPYCPLTANPTQINSWCLPSESGGNYSPINELTFEDGPAPPASSVCGLNTASHFKYAPAAVCTSSLKSALAK